MRNKKEQLKTYQQYIKNHNQNDNFDVTAKDFRKSSTFIFIIFVCIILLYKVLPSIKVVNNQNKADGLIKELKTIAIAHRNYVKDTKFLLPLAKKNSSKRTTTNLIKNSNNLKTWAGPYLKGYKKGKNNFITKSDFSNIFIEYYTKYRRNCSKNNCHTWVSMQVPKNYQETLKNVDKQIDGQISGKNGKFLYKRLKNAYLISYLIVI